MANDETQAVIRSAQERSAALVRADSRKLRDLCTDDFVYTNASGRTFDLGDYLRFYIDSGDMRWSSQDLSDTKVNLYGATAVLTCLVLDRASYRGESFEATFRSTQVWIREDGDWKCAAIQTTEVR